uniref:G-protein coupled receptors family 1 profile domain-containing protein n=1 Tax=Oryzias sinensis TaxID=183150 RepID=A0A8C7YX29_9TELE
LDFFFFFCNLILNDIIYLSIPRSESLSGSLGHWSQPSYCWLKVGVPLNGLVLWALGLQTRAANSFRVYVLNLALADIILLLRTPVMLGFLINNCSWPFGYTFCRIIMFLRVLGLYASAFLICAVALERTLCLLRPVWAQLRRPAWAVPVACSLLWLVATALSAPYLYFAYLQEHKGALYCKESGNFTMGLFVIETTAGFLVPLLVFLGSNLAVVLTIKRVVPLTPSSSAPSMARKMTRMYHVLFITMFLFITCWVPYFVCRFIDAITRGTNMTEKVNKAIYISLFLVYVKSALNPVLYVFAARGLSRAIKASLVSTIERFFNDDSFESIRRKSIKNSQRKKLIQFMFIFNSKNPLFLKKTV